LGSSHLGHIQIVSALRDRQMQSDPAAHGDWLVSTSLRFTAEAFCHFILPCTFSARYRRILPRSPSTWWTRRTLRDDGDMQSDTVAPALRWLAGKYFSPRSQLQNNQQISFTFTSQSKTSHLHWGSVHLGHIQIVSALRDRQMQSDPAAHGDWLVSTSLRFTAEAFSIRPCCSAHSETRLTMVTVSLVDE